MSAESVEVIAISVGFINGVYRVEGEVFRVASGQEFGSSWFRPVAVSSIPQGPSPSGAPKAPSAKPVYRRKNPALSHAIDPDID